MIAIGVAVAESRVTRVYTGADSALAFSTALLVLLVLVVGLLLRPVVIVSALPTALTVGSCATSRRQLRRNRIALLCINIRARHANAGGSGHELARSQGYRRGPVQSSEACAVDTAVSHAHPFDVKRGGGGSHSACCGWRDLPTEDPGDSPSSTCRTNASPSPTCTDGFPSQGRCSQAYGTVC